MAGNAVMLCNVLFGVLQTYSDQQPTEKKFSERKQVSLGTVAELVKEKELLLRV